MQNILKILSSSILVWAKADQKLFFIIASLRKTEVFHLDLLDMGRCKGICYYVVLYLDMVLLLCKMYSCCQAEPAWHYNHNGRAQWTAEGVIFVSLPKV